jgi:hypothetical protein
MGVGGFLGGVPDDGQVVYDWSKLGERRFEDLCRALAVHVLGPEVQAFGDGPDGGREASFDGPVRYAPGAGGPWNGYGVLQAKYRRTGVGQRMSSGCAGRSRPSWTRGLTLWGVKMRSRWA